jgi:DNA-binding transcriptional MocR family regulator
MMRPYKPKFTLIDSDSRGMRPESLQQELEKLGTPEEFKSKKGMPKML